MVRMLLHKLESMKTTQQEVLLLKKRCVRGLSVSHISTIKSIQNAVSIFDHILLIGISINGCNCQHFDISELFLCFEKQLQCPSIVRTHISIENHKFRFWFDLRIDLRIDLNTKIEQEKTNWEQMPDAEISCLWVFRNISNRFNTGDAFLRSFYLIEIIVKLTHNVNLHWVLRSGRRSSTPSSVQKKSENSRHVICFFRIHLDMNICYLQCTFHDYTISFFICQFIRFFLW